MPAPSDQQQRLSAVRARLTPTRLASVGLLSLVILLLGPLIVLLQGRVDLDSHWSMASHASTGLAPDPASESAAVIQVYGARTFNWRAAFGIHTWIAAKRRGASSYTVYQVIGWRARAGASAVSVERGVTPDARWYNAVPTLLAQRRGDEVEAMIDRLEAALARYPHTHEYRVWPGPNSNTFIAHLLRALPELRADLPPTAIGKDYLPGGALLAKLPSGTGWQGSLWGMAGLAIGLEEGIEFNLLGLSAGLDVNDVALRWPGLGRIGPWVAAAP